MFEVIFERKEYPDIRETILSNNRNIFCITKQKQEEQKTNKRKITNNAQREFRILFKEISVYIICFRA